MKQFVSRLKNTASVLSVVTLLLGLAVGLHLHSGAKVEAAPGGGGRTSYFLKLDGVSGESMDAKHKGEIELNSYAWSKDDPGLVQSASTGAGGGGGAGKVELHDLYFTTNVSKASPQLMEAAANGKHFKEAVLTVRKDGKNQQEYMVVKLTDILVSSYRSTGSEGNAPIDEFSLNFAKIEFSYTPQKADGSLDNPVIGSWDFKGNKSAE